MYSTALRVRSGSTFAASKPGAAGPTSASAKAKATDLALELLPFASSTVGEVVEAAIRRRIHEMVEEQIVRLLGPATPADAGADADLGAGPDDT